MRLATTVALPAIRGPVPLAKQLAAIDVLSGGRVVAGVGPGRRRTTTRRSASTSTSGGRGSTRSIRVLRAFWRDDPTPFVGRYYSTADVHLEPRPVRPEGIPIWVGSWGSDAGLRRVARLADGWLASAYNTTPEQFGRAVRRLREMLGAAGKDASAFPNAIATMWFHISDDRDEAERVLQERLVPHVRRDPDELRARLSFGPADDFAAKLRALAAAGVQRVYVWPVADEIEQLERFWTTVRPAVG